LTELQKNDTGLGVGLEVSSTDVRSAIFCKEATFQPLVYAELPGVYKPWPELGGFKPASLSDWLNPSRLQIHTDNRKREKVIANDILRHLIKSVLSRAKERLGTKVDYICATVVASMSERERSRLRAIIQELGFDVELLNEDQALLKAHQKLHKTQSLLIYNLLSSSIEITWYQRSGQVLSLENLECLDNCGLDDLDAELLRALLDRTPSHSLSISQFHSMRESVRTARQVWKQGEPFTLSSALLPGLEGTSLPAEQVTDIFEATFASSLGTVRRLIGGTNPAPVIVFLGPTPHIPYVTSRLQQAAGGQVMTVNREKVLEGAAIYAWESRGTRTVNCPTNADLPDLIGFSNGRHSHNGVPFQQPANTTSESLNLQERETKQPNLLIETKDYTNNMLRIMEPLSAEQIQSIIPHINLIFEEFMAKALDQAAKKLIDHHRFRDALAIYEKFWRKNSGFQRLTTPAVGLCLAQANNAMKERHWAEVKHWSRKGLQFDRNNPDLLNLKRVAKSQGK
jgi:hypothetical protein